MNKNTIKKQSVFAFIDSQNLNLGVRSQGWILDFKRFRVFLEEKYKVNSAYLFIGYVTGNEDLYSYLRNSGYIVIFKPTVKKFGFKKGEVKGNVDAELVLHSMIQYENYDKAIIVSGDGDFYCLVEYLEKKNKFLKMIVPNKRYSSLLRKYANFIILVGSFRFKVQMNNVRTKKGRHSPGTKPLGSPPIVMSHFTIKKIKKSRGIKKPRM